MKYYIAVATSNGEEVDLHFGRAEEFWVYGADAETGVFSLVEKRAVTEAMILGHSAAQDAQNGNEEAANAQAGCSGGGCNDARTEYIAGLLSDCEFLLVAKIGPRPHRILLRSGVSALETPYAVEYAAKKLNDYYRKRSGNGGIS